MQCFLLHAESSNQYLEVSVYSTSNGTFDFISVSALRDNFITFYSIYYGIGETVANCQTSHTIIEEYPPSSLTQTLNIGSNLSQFLNQLESNLELCFLLTITFQSFTIMIKGSTHLNAAVDKHREVLSTLTTDPDTMTYQHNDAHGISTVITISITTLTVTLFLAITIIITILVISLLRRRRISRWTKKQSSNIYE